MKARKSLKFLAVAMTFAVVLAGCEELLGGITDFGLDEYIDNLEEGELTVTVTNADAFGRADVWVEPFDISEIDISLDDLDDDDTVEAEVENWVDDHDAPDNFNEVDDIYAGYGSDEINGGTVEDEVTTDAELNGTIMTGDDTILDGNMYVVYVVLTDENNGNGSAEIGVTFAIVDGDSSVSIPYDEDEFEEFTP